MDIKYLGHASFYIKSKEAALITDPFDSSIGIKFPKIDADVVTVSHTHPDHSNASAIGGSPLIITWPGEFERKGMRVSGFSSFHDKKNGQERGENILYKIEADGMSILHCGDLGLVPNDEFVEEIGEVDVLLVPVGGFYTIDSSEAVDLVKKIEPSIVIPMHYNQSQLDQKVFGSLSSVDEFTKKIGAGSEAPIPKLTLKKEDLQEEMKVVVMEISK